MNHRIAQTKKDHVPREDRAKRAKWQPTDEQLREWWERSADHWVECEYELCDWWHNFNQFLIEEGIWEKQKEAVSRAKGG